MNCYRKALDHYLKNGKPYIVPESIAHDLTKPSHRKYCTGFYLGDTKENECYETSKPRQTYDFIAIVLESKEGGAIVEMRNRFKVGDELEVLSPNEYHNSLIKVENMENEKGESIDDALLVRQKIFLRTSVPLQKGDILRRKASEEEK